MSLGFKPIAFLGVQVGVNSKDFSRGIEGAGSAFGSLGPGREVHLEGLGAQGMGFRGLEVRV